MLHDIPCGLHMSWTDTKHFLSFFNSIFRVHLTLEFGSILFVCQTRPKYLGTYNLHTYLPSTMEHSS